MNQPEIKPEIRLLHLLHVAAHSGDVACVQPSEAEDARRLAETLSKPVKIYVLPKLPKP